MGKKRDLEKSKEEKMLANRAKLAVPGTNQGFMNQNYEKVKQPPYKDPSVSKENKGKA